MAKGIRIKIGPDSIIDFLYNEEILDEDNRITVDDETGLPFTMETIGKRVAGHWKIGLRAAYREIRNCFHQFDIDYLNSRFIAQRVGLSDHYQRGATSEFGKYFYEKYGLGRYDDPNLYSRERAKFIRRKEIEKLKNNK